jgi:hypothetical protein
MASKRSLHVSLSLALVWAACVRSPRPFPQREPMQHDTDLKSVSVPCHPEPTAKDPQHVSCAPAPYESSFAWDGADNSIFRPFTQVLAVDAVDPKALNVNSVDEVPDSAWFTNRIGQRTFGDEEIARGACTDAQYLDGEAAAEGSWVVDKGKQNGSTPGFRVNIPGKGKYLFKSDEGGTERASGSSVVGAAIYHAAGLYTSCEQVVYFKRSALRLAPGLTFANNNGVPEPFDDKALDRVLAGATRRGEYTRMQASAWLPGYLLGPFRYEGTREDDPNDVIPHDQRRELRGARLLAAWIDHFDSREQNSMDTWIADRKDAPDSSPGYVRHYYLDLSDTLGSEWDWDSISRRLGYSYVLDWKDIFVDFVTLGIPQRRWDRVHKTPGREAFGYFNAEDFVPEEWKNEYPNPAFSRMTEADGAWMARILARFSPHQIELLVKAGRFSDPGDVQFLSTVLQRRLDKILQRYLTRLSPVADVRLESSLELCGVDLAERRGVRDSSRFAYRAFDEAQPEAALEIKRGPDGGVCVALPAVTAEAPVRYARVRLYDGVAPGPLVAHLYASGASKGYQLAGLERLQE